MWDAQLSDSPSVIFLDLISSSLSYQGQYQGRLLLFFVASSAISIPNGDMVGRITNHILKRCVDRMLLLGVFLSVILLCVPISAIPLKSKILNLVTVPNIDRSPSQIGLTSPSLNSQPPVYTVECLENRPGVNLATVAEDCTTLFKDLSLRTDEAFQKRSSSRPNHIHSNGHWVTARWAFGQCTISTRYSQVASLDRSTLLDVALIANEILSECVTSDSKGQGGFVSAGSNEELFYVGLQGQLANMNVNGIDDPDDTALPDLDLSKRSLDARVANRDLTRLQRRKVDSSGALILLNQATSLSNSTGNLKTAIDHELKCFSVGSHLRYAVADDCRFIINHIILGMNDPFRVQTWGFTDDVDIDLSLPEYEWVYEHCYVRVSAADETMVDRFRPIDVAEQALRLVETCIVDVKEPLGGYADIGNLDFTDSFYVVVAGTSKPLNAQSKGSSNILSLPFDRPRTLEGRANLNSLQESAISREDDDVRCFDPSFVHRLAPASVSDCNVIIDEIIPRLPDVMREQSFGYTSAEDVDLSIRGNGQWIHDSCVVFVGTADKEGRDVFRYVDIAVQAERVIEQCVEVSKYARGGTVPIGEMDETFYVTVGGLGPLQGNGTILVLPSNARVSSPASRISVPALLHE